MEKNYICNINGIDYDLREVCELILNKESIEGCKILAKMANISMFQNDFCDYVRQHKEVPRYYDPYIPNNSRANYTNTKPIIKCPTCSSTNVREISTLERNGSFFFFGFGSNKLNKTFKCNNCNYTW